MIDVTIFASDELSLRLNLKNIHYDKGNNHQGQRDSSFLQLLHLPFRRLEVSILLFVFFG